MKLYNGAAILLLALCPFWLSGCVTVGSSFEWSQARQVKAGMTQAEVEKLMGRPSQVVSQDGTERWVWSSGSSNLVTSSGKAFSVDFKNGKVVIVPTIPASFQ